MLKRLETLAPGLDAMFRPGGKVFYGWWIVLAAAVVQWLAALTWMHSFGAYAVLLKAEFGWSMSVLSFAFAVTRLETGLLGPLQGWMVDRFGTTAVLRAGFVIFGVGFVLFSQMQSVYSYFFAVILIALGASLSGHMTLTTAIVNWFDRHRSKAIAWAMVGFSVGGLSVPLIVLGLELLGWRQMAFVSGIVVAVVGLLLANVIRHRPAEIGEVPDGVSSSELGPDPGRRAGTTLQRVSFTWRQALKTSSFWLISIGHGFALLAVSSMLAHLIPHLTVSLGYSIAAAGVAFSLMTGAQMIGIFLGGWLGDRVSKRFLTGLCMFGHSLGLLVVIEASNFYLIVVFALLHGLAWGIRAPIMNAQRADYFGPESFGTILGISSLIAMLGMSFGPIICGVLFDLHGDYRLAFASIAAVSALGAACFWAAAPPKPVSE